MNCQILHKQSKAATAQIIKRAASHHAKTKEALLPPLMLYRRILRAHRMLPEIQRSVGDKYVKNEFKLHKSTDNPLHIVGFLTSWQDYLHMITNGEWQEGTLSKSALDKMSPQQVGQLYELMKETERIYAGEVSVEDKDKK